MTTPYDSDFREIWDEHVNPTTVDEIQERTGWSADEVFDAHFEVLLHNPDFAGTSPGDQLSVFEDYTNIFVNGEGRFSEFFEHWQYAEENFDWAAWREAMGYN